ncbi:recombinase family protein [Pseudomonas triclosanedens]|uniref:recombinase family protein n=1 Tax=Pseudomonas triclosanedens TaxID=2961893 RepID=UPI0020C52354|nr:recombinase family protein [Pseudomonas triclosanedens]MCP8469947.1 recombinase family protein [Pseudomonas triclosanedens]
MSRTFLYARVSTADQTTDNQLLEVQAAGFDVLPSRAVAETVSGAVPSGDRPGFQRLLERMEEGDILLVTKLDRLGRNAMDVRSTIELLAGRGIKVHCLALGGADLTSAAGKMTMQVLVAVAEFERDLLIERTQAGLMRAKAQGKKLGRPHAVGTREKVQQLRAEGLSQSKVAERLGVHVATVKRHWAFSEA